MSAVWARSVAWGSWALSTTVMALALVLFFSSGPPFLDGLNFGVTTAALFSLPTVGLFLAVRRPSSPIGWLFCLGGLGIALLLCGEEYVNRALVEDPGALPAGSWVAWVNTWVYFPTLFLPLTLLLILFPDGRPPGPRWKFVIWGLGVTVVMASTGLALSPELYHPDLDITNPLSVPDGAGKLFEWMSGLGWLSSVIAAVVAASSLAVRFRRSIGEERQQIKWVAAAAVYLAVTQVASGILFELSDFAEGIAGILSGTGFASLPVATAIAVARYRLYDIDLIINRTLAYGALSIVVVGTYIALVGGLGWLVRETVGQGSNELAVAGTTLVVAAMFQPARRRIQAAVDRRFYRSRYDAAQTLEAFQSRLRDQTDLESLRNELLGVVQGTVQPARASLWLREPPLGRAAS